jgi:hypothetical protein
MSPDETDAERTARWRDRVVNRMEAIDRLIPEQRALVHEYGWTIVDSFLRCGVRKPERIRYLVETVLNERSPLREAFSIQGFRSRCNRPADL